MSMFGQFCQEQADGNTEKKRPVESLQSNGKSDDDAAPPAPFLGLRKKAKKMMAKKELSTLGPRKSYGSKQ